MDEAMCECGCGKALPKGKTRGFRYGHKPKETTQGRTDSNDTGQAVAPVGEGAVDEPIVADKPETIECVMTRQQLDRIWATLPLREAAVAILTALEEDPSAA